MLYSTLILTLRNFFRNLSYSFIILSGLVVGLTTAILVFLWVEYELSFDRYHHDNERVFAVLMNEVVDGGIETYEETPAPLADYLNSEISEVESFTRFDNTQGLLSYGAKSIQRYGMYVDSGYFDVFHPEIISGNSAQPFPDNKSIVISRELAQLLFDSDDVLGNVITLDKTNDFKVTGVFSEFPENSSLRSYEFVLPFHAKPREIDEWQNYYVKLSNKDMCKAVEAKIDEKLSEFLGNQNTKSLLFCLTDWRLHWSFENGKVSGGRIVYVIIFSVTALFILIMAAINYVNIMTASAAKRAREIGVRKVTGATQYVLIRQFLTESLSMTFAATFISLLVSYLLLPFFNQLTGVELTISFANPVFLVGLFSMALFMGLLAGSYPAFLLSSLKPAIILKGNSSTVLTGAGLRKSLIVFQFTLSTILIFSAMVMQQQTNYLLRKDLGYDKTNVINIWLPAEFPVSLQSFKEEIAMHASVSSVGLCGASPMEVNGYAEVRWPGKTHKNPVMLNGVTADHDLLPALKFELVQGRNFIPSDSSNFIINQKAADLLGFSDPIGQTITYSMFGDQEGKIVGVIKDFHNEDIHAPIDPVIFAFTSENNLNNLFVRYTDGQLEEALDHIKTTFNKFQPDISLPYSFLDNDFENQFYQEKLLGRFSTWATIIAFIIAGIGLFGLTIFNTQKRAKEIGVRKVLGASVMQILILLCRDFLRPILISILLAFPLSYYLMARFLEGYAFRIDIPALSFIVVGMVMIVFVLLVVSYQSLLAAVKNPVESLKTE